MVNMKIENSTISRNVFMSGVFVATRNSMLSFSLKRNKRIFLCKTAF